MYHSLLSLFLFTACHASCMFIHAMFVACSLMPCTLPVYPYHVRCLFIHAMYVACLFMPCTLHVYPCHVWWLFIQAILWCMLCIYHVSRLSTMQHTKKSFRHSWLFPFSVEWLAVKWYCISTCPVPVFTLHCQLTCCISNTQPQMTSVFSSNSFFSDSSMQRALNDAS